MKYLVSVITPVYNSERFIARAIESIIVQSYENWELLLIDDSSTDDSVKIIKQYVEKDKRIRLFESRINSGAAKTRNIGIKNAKGRFIGFLDSDDYWTPKKLEKQVSFMIKSKIAFSYTGYNIIFQDTQRILKKEVPEIINFNRLLSNNIICCSTVLLDVKETGKIFFPNIRRRQDFALWLIVLRNHNLRAYGLNNSLTIYTSRSDSISHDWFKLLKDQWRLYNKIIALSWSKSLYYFGVYILTKIKQKITLEFNLKKELK